METFTQKPKLIIPVNTMCYHLKTQHGNIEAVIDDNCGVSKFYTIAATLSDELNVKFISQIKHTDTLNWDFTYKNQLLTLHYSVFKGVSLSPQHIKSIVKENNLVLEVASFLERRAY